MMRASVGWLAAAALCLGAVSSAHAQTQFTPFSASNGVNFNSSSSPSNGVTYNPFGNTTTSAAATNAQATFPAPGASLSGPSRLIDLMPSLHSLTNKHYIGFSMFPSQTDQYLAQFGFKRLR